MPPHEFLPAKGDDLPTLLSKRNQAYKCRGYVQARLRDIKSRFFFRIVDGGCGARRGNKGSLVVAAMYQAERKEFYRDADMALKALQIVLNAEIESQRALDWFDRNTKAR